MLNTLKVAQRSDQIRIFLLAKKNTNSFISLYQYCYRYSRDIHFIFSYFHYCILQDKNVSYSWQHYSEDSRKAGFIQILVYAADSIRSSYLHSPRHIDRLHEEHDQVEESWDEDVPRILFVPLFTVLMLLARVFEPVSQTRHTFASSTPLSGVTIKVLLLLLLPLSILLLLFICFLSSNL